MLVMLVLSERLIEEGRLPEAVAHAMIGCTTKFCVDGDLVYSNGEVFDLYEPGPCIRLIVVCPE